MTNKSFGNQLLEGITKEAWLELPWSFLEFHRMFVAAVEDNPHVIKPLTGMAVAVTKEALTWELPASQQHTLNVYRSNLKRIQTS